MLLNIRLRSEQLSFNYYIKFVLLLIVNNFLGANCDKLPHVTIPQGKLQGLYLKSYQGNSYEAFLGVPYAKPPVGDLRFKDPQPPSPWIGTYNGTTYGSDCLQYTHFQYQVVGTEDCLFLNVYKPIGTKNKDGKNWDVIVHIHGGAFTFFSGKGFYPDKIMDYDVIFVSMNYRLGPLGFMSTGDKVLPGNLGLKDQSAALKWVKNNIEYFNGDSNKITITGMSAGGVSVHYHYLSPLSKGLFNRGISSSGAVLNPWALAEDVPKKTKLIGALIGCPTSNSAELVKCFNTRPAEQIVAQVPIFLGWLFSPYTPFGPVIEPEDAEAPFITRHPYDIIKDGQAAQVPWLASFTTEEGLYPASEFVDNPELMRKLEDTWLDKAPHILDFNYTTASNEHRNRVTQIINKHYLKQKSITNGIKELVQMIGDRLFGSGIVQSALMQVAASDKTLAPVYLYHFGYRGTYSVSQAFSHSDTNFGVCHADDAGYVLDSVMYKNMLQTNEDKAMSQRMINLWISFTKKGVPEFFNNEPLPKLKADVNNIRYFRINSANDAKEQIKADLGEFKFWSTVPLDERLTLPSNFNSAQDEL